MGGCASVAVPVNLTEQQKEIERNIEARVESNKSQDKKVFKLLLLGAGECGKSTILKQMKILHKQGFKPDEIRTYQEVILKNVLESVQSLCQAMIELSLEYELPENKTQGEKIALLPDTYEPVHNDAPVYQAIWKDKGIQEAMKRQREFHFLDSGPWLLENCHTLLAPGYVPNNDSILRSRVATTGIHHTKFSMDGSTFRMYDVGGQRGERKKWIHCFEHVAGILFIASLIEYDTVLAEDRGRMRLHESLALFQGIINLPWFKNAAIILFLNKDDLFKEKIKRVPISRYFPEFLANNSATNKATNNKDYDYDSGQTFIRDLYLAKNGDEAMPIYVQCTDATNTENIEFVWKCTKHLILERNLTDSGLTCV